MTYCQHRHIGKVIEEILIHIPKDNHLWHLVDYIGRDVAYKPPEMWAGYWYELGRLISNIAGDTQFKDLEEWQKKVIEILTTKTRKELEEQG